MYDGITKLCSDFHLVNLMFHPAGRDDLTTYARISKHIDYILCDAWVSDASLQGCYEPFQYHVKGDHRAMVVDFDTPSIWQSYLHTCYTSPMRIFIQRRWLQLEIYPTQAPISHSTPLRLPSCSLTRNMGPRFSRTIRQRLPAHLIQHS